MVQLVGGLDGMQPVPVLMPHKLLERGLPMRLQRDRRPRARLPFGQGRRDPHAQFQAGQAAAVRARLQLRADLEGAVGTPLPFARGPRPMVFQLAPDLTHAVAADGIEHGPLEDTDGREPGRMCVGHGTGGEDSSNQGSKNHGVSQTPPARYHAARCRITAPRVARRLLLRPRRSRYPACAPRGLARSLGSRASSRSSRQALKVMAEAISRPAPNTALDPNPASNLCTQTKVRSPPR